MENIAMAISLSLTWFLLGFSIARSLYKKIIKRQNDELEDIIIKHTHEISNTHFNACRDMINTCAKFWKIDRTKVIDPPIPPIDSSKH